MKIYDSMNIYEEYIVDEYMDNDEISDVEEGFMKGYLASWGNQNVANKNKLYGMGWLQEKDWFSWCFLVAAKC